MNKRKFLIKWPTGEFLVEDAIKLNPEIHLSTLQSYVTLGLKTGKLKVTNKKVSGRGRPSRVLATV